MDKIYVRNYELKLKGSILERLILLNLNMEIFNIKIHTSN